ncbi:beta-lactamase family protein [Sphingomonas sabuli]|uniref:Beta-lactamase family protein n=1 Tax=Sphingomonas sabuli TaxID=2764186 RepID=A0A7G9L5J0_9SPHN|nr:serine hydrolase domain-containing protein [Sphingomonas sabuli]QNM83889.1 beta-lactamase family protein [Sphingomonas sabuli]
MKLASAAVAALALAGCTTVRPAPQPLAQAGIAFDRGGEIGAFADGLADPQARRPVTPDDPVRIASISKIGVAIGVMKLVESGRLDLDADVSTYLGWTLRNPAFPSRPITLRQLLSHTSSIRDSDDQYAIPLGRTVRSAVASPASWDPLHAPGAGYFTYSNMNFPVVGSIVERVTGERFDRWMRANVLDPMGIDACYNWPTCSDAAVARAVQLSEPDGTPIRDDLHGRRPACPVYVEDPAPCDLTLWKAGDNGALFAPQGGLRISVRGLARIGRLLLGGGTLDGVRILSPRSVDALLAPAWRFDGTNGQTDGGFYCTYGLATQTIPTRAAGCDDDPAGDGVVRVGHAGEAYGLRSGLWIDRARGTGVAYFSTGLGDDPPRGDSAYRISEEIAFARALALGRR